MPTKHRSWTFYKPLLCLPCLSYLPWPPTVSSCSHACPWSTHNAGVPASEEEPVGEKVRFARLSHLLLQRSEQVVEPGEGFRVPAQPVEVDLGCRGEGLLKVEQSRSGRV